MKLTQMRKDLRKGGNNNQLKSILSMIISKISDQFDMILYIYEEWLVKKWNGQSNSLQIKFQSFRRTLAFSRFHNITQRCNNQCSERVQYFNKKQLLIYQQQEQLNQYEDPNEISLDKFPNQDNGTILEIDFNSNKELSNNSQKQEVGIKTQKNEYQFKVDISVVLLSSFIKKSFFYKDFGFEFEINQVLYKEELQFIILDLKRILNQVVLTQGVYAYNELHIAFCQFNEKIIKKQNNQLLVYLNLKYLDQRKYIKINLYFWLESYLE